MDVIYSLSDILHCLLRYIRIIAGILMSLDVEADAKLKIPASGDRRNGARLQLESKSGSQSRGLDAWEGFTGTVWSQLMGTVPLIPVHALVDGRASSSLSWGGGAWAVQVLPIDSFHAAVCSEQLGQWLKLLPTVLYSDIVTAEDRPPTRASLAYLLFMGGGGGNIEGPRSKHNNLRWLLDAPYLSLSLHFSTTSRRCGTGPVHDEKRTTAQWKISAVVTMSAPEKSRPLEPARLSVRAVGPAERRATRHRKVVFATLLQAWKAEVNRNWPPACGTLPHEQPPQESFRVVLGSDVLTAVGSATAPKLDSTVGSSLTLSSLSAALHAHYCVDVYGGRSRADDPLCRAMQCAINATDSSGSDSFATSSDNTTKGSRFPLSLRRRVVDSRSHELWVHTRVANADPAHTATVTVLEPICACFQSLLSTYVYEVVPLNNTQPGENSWTGEGVNLVMSLANTRLISHPSSGSRGGAREALSHVSVTLSVPPLHEVRLTYKGMKLFLSREDFGKDASKGCSVPPAVVHLDEVRSTINSSSDTVPVFNLTNTHLDRFYYTSFSLIMMPIPDFTMPFNVITLVRISYTAYQ